MMLRYKTSKPAKKKTKEDRRDEERGRDRQEHIEAKVKEETRNTIHTHTNERKNGLRKKSNEKKSTTQ